MGTYTLEQMGMATFTFLRRYGDGHLLGRDGDGHLHLRRDEDGQPHPGSDEMG